MAVVPTTKLEAVNIMLWAIGEQSVSSIDPQDITQEAALAEKILDTVSRDVQALGWYFNEGLDVTLALDGNFKIPIPSNALKVLVTGETDLIGIRGGFLWNRSENTDIFADTVDAYIVYGLDFVDLPQAAKTYIAIRAARVFQQRVLGADSLDKYSIDDEQRAWVLLTQDEVDNQGFSIADWGGMRKWRNVN